MIWGKGYEATYYMAIVDPRTWRDIDRIEITGGSINRESEGLYNSAAVNCRRYTEGETWARVYLDAKQGDSAEHIPLITGLTSVPQRAFDGVLPSAEVQIYSVLKPMEDLLLPRGWYTAGGANGAKVIADLLKGTPAPVIVTGDAPYLTEAIIAEQGETNLSMIDKILTALNWRLRITGDGTIELTEKPTQTAATFDATNADFLEPGITIERDWFTCPNVYRATSGDQSATAKDEDPNSPLSIQNRGREVWREEEAADFNDGETLAEYAARRLKEAQQIATTANYTRRFLPDVYPGDLLLLNYPEQDLQGIYRIDSQNITFGHAAKTAEEVSKIG